MCVLHPSEQGASERAVEKTHGGDTGDNARTRYLRDHVAAGENVDLYDHILQPSVDETRRAAEETESKVTQEAINRAVVAQAGDLFAIQHLQQSGERVRDFDERVNGPDAKPATPTTPRTTTGATSRTGRRPDSR